MVSHYAEEKKQDTNEKKNPEEKNGIDYHKIQENAYQYWRRKEV